MALDEPVRFEEQVAGQLQQLVVLHVEDLQQRALHPFWQLLQVVIGCAQLPQTAAAEQPAAHRNTRGWLKSVPAH